MGKNLLKILLNALKTKTRMTLLSGAALFFFYNSGEVCNAADYTVDGAGAMINAVSGEAFATGTALKTSGTDLVNIVNNKSINVNNGTLIIQNNTNNAGALTTLNTVNIIGGKTLTTELNTGTLTIEILNLNNGIFTNTKGGAIGLLTITTNNGTINSAIETSAKTTDLGGTLNITGAGTVGLGALTLTANGTISSTAAKVTATSTNIDGRTLTTNGTGAIELGVLTLTDSGTINVLGTGNISTGAVTIIADKTLTLSGAGVGTVALGATIINGAGTITNNHNAGDTISSLTAYSNLILDGSKNIIIEKTLQLGGNLTTGTAGFTVNGLTTANNAMTLNVGTGDVNLTGGLRLNNADGTINITNAGNVVIGTTSGTQSTNIGGNTLVLQQTGGAGTTTLNDIRITAGGTLTNNNAGNVFNGLTISGSVTINGANAGTILGTTTFISSGTLNTGTQKVTLTNLTLDANAAINAGTGNIDIIGEINISNNKLTFNADNEIKLTNTGTIKINGGVFTNNNSDGTIATLTITNGATINGTNSLTAGTTNLSGTLNVSNGKLTTDTLTLTGNLTSTINAGGEVLVNNTTNINSRTLTIDGDKNVTLGTISIAGGGLTNNNANLKTIGTLTITGAGATIRGNKAVNGTTVNLAGTLRNENKGGLTIETINLTNSATISGAEATKIGTVTSNGTALTTSGNNIIITNGTFENTTLTNSGTLSITNLTLGTTTVNNSKTISIDTLNLTGGASTISGIGTTEIATANIDENLTITGGVVKIAGGVVVATKTLVNSGGTLYITSNLENKGIVNTTGAGQTVLDGGKFDNTTAAGTLGTLTITDKGGTLDGGNATITATNLNGKLNIGGGNWNLGTATVTGNSELAGIAGTISNTTINGGTLVIDNSSTGWNLNNLTITGKGVLGVGGTAAITSTTLEGDLKIMGDGWDLNTININYNNAKISGGESTITNFNTITFGSLANQNLTFANVNGSVATTSAHFTTGNNIAVGNNETLVLGANTQLNTGTFTLGAGGTLQIYLGDMAEQSTNPAVHGDNAILTATNITFTDPNGFKISGGEKGKIYELVVASNADTTNANLKKALDNNNRFLYHYESVAANGLVTIGVYGNNPGEIAKIAMANSTANMGISEMIEKLQFNEKFKETIGLILNDTENPGQAVTELNGANAANTTIQLGQNAAQAFNCAIGQVFANVQTANVLVNSGVIPENITQSSTAENSASAGGTPITYHNANNLCAQKYGGFVKAYGGWGQNASNKQITGYNFGGAGVLMGVDYKLARELIIGGLVGYSFNESTLYHDLGNATDQVLRAGIYSQFTWDNLYFNSAPTFGIHLIESQRKIAFMNNEIAKGERTSFDFNWYNEGGYTFNVQNYLITPSYSLAMTYLRDSSYGETGAIAGSHFDAYASWSLTQNVGVKLGRLYSLNEKLSLLPEIWAGWEYEFVGANDISMSLAIMPDESRWNAPVQRIDRNRVVFGASLTTIVSDRYEIFGRYDQKLWSGGFQTNFTVGVSMKF